MSGLVTSGCQRQVELAYNTSSAVQELPEKLQETIGSILLESCGTPLSPKPLCEGSGTAADLKRGAVIYQRRCALCHGASGDGAGEVAEYMYPRPRDYRRGIFKFTSTPYGARPRREDLVRTIRNGAQGTSMPSFNELPDQEIEDVVDYVILLAQRGELETLLALDGQNEDEIDPERVSGYVSDICRQWAAAEDQYVRPLTKMVPYSRESVEKGKQAFLTETAGCFKCHGADGTGKTTENVKGFTDIWGSQTRAADLTAGMFHGGDRPDDIYRRIYSGINGTPMPAFNDKLSSEPDTFWNLVHYVQYISGARRREVVASQDKQVVAEEGAAADPDAAVDISESSESGADTQQ